MNSAVKPWALALAAAGSVCAMADGEDPYADYVKLTKSDKSINATSFSSAGNWDDGFAPHSDTNYYVEAGKALYYSGVSDTDYAVSNLWKGGELVVAGMFFDSVGWGNQYGPRIPNLKLLGGCEVRVATYGPFWDMDEKGTRTTVTIDSTPEKPVLFSQHYSSSLFSSGGARYNELRARFLGTDDSVVVFTRPFTNYNGTAIDNGFFFCHAESEDTFAEYPGTIIARGGNTIFSPYSGTLFGFNYPISTFRVEDGAVTLMHNRNNAYNKYNTYREFCRLKGFELIDGSTQFAYASLLPCPTIVATNTFILGAKGRFNVPITVDNVVGMGPEDTRARFVRLAHLEGPAAENAVMEDGFTVKLLDAPVIDEEVSLELVDNGDGTKDLWLGGDFVAMTNQNVESTGYPAGSVQYGALDGNHPEDWSNGVTPPTDSTHHYFATKKLCNFQDVSYPNAKLTYGANSSWKGGNFFQFKEINFLAGKSHGLWGGGNRILRAERIRILPITDSAFTLYVFSTYLTIDAPLEGDADVVMHNNGDNIGSIAPIGLSTNFHGKITLRQQNTKTPYKFQFFLADGRNLGGVYVGSDTNAAIEFASHPLVSVTNDVFFAEPTRTVKITEGVKFDVLTGKRLTLGSRTTWSGEVVKAGNGTMELSGEARFGDGNPGTLPTAGKNGLAVEAGALRVGSKLACDGLAVSFAAGAKLQLALDAEGDVAQYGLYDVKWASPLSFADEKLKVEFVGDAPESKVVRGICTVSSEAAETLSESSFTVARPRGCIARVSRVNNGDSTVTFAAAIMKAGTAVLVR